MKKMYLFGFLMCVSFSLLAQKKFSTLPNLTPKKGQGIRFQIGKGDNVAFGMTVDELIDSTAPGIYPHIISGLVETNNALDFRRKYVNEASGRLSYVDAVGKRLTIYSPSSGNSSTQVIDTTPNVVNIFPVFSLIGNTYQRTGWFDNLSKKFSTKRVNVVGSGQSNMVGITTATDLGRDSLFAAWNGTAYVMADINAAPFSGGATWGYYLARQYARDGYIVRYAQSALSSQPISQWTPATQTQYVNLKATMIASGLQKPDVFLWAQGEADVAQTVAYYDSKLSDFTSQLVSDNLIDTTKVKFLMLDHVSKSPLSAYIRTQNKGWRTFVPTFSATNSDGIHYDTKGSITNAIMAYNIANGGIPTPVITKLSPIVSTSSEGAPYTGCFIVKTGVKPTTNSFVRYRIEVSEYGSINTYVCSWFANTSAFSQVQDQFSYYASSPQAKPLQLGKKGGTYYLVVGDTASVFFYPRVEVYEGSTELNAGNVDIFEYREKTAWSITASTSLSSVNPTISIAPVSINGIELIADLKTGSVTTGYIRFDTKMKFLTGAERIFKFQLSLNTYDSGHFDYLASGYLTGTGVVNTALSRLQSRSPDVLFAKNALGNLVVLVGTSSSSWSYVQAKLFLVQFNGTSGGDWFPERLGVSATVTTNISDVTLLTTANDVNNQGILLPRLTTTQRNALTPVEGLKIYNTTLKKEQFYNGTAWETITSS